MSTNSLYRDVSMSGTEARTLEYVARLLERLADNRTHYPTVGASRYSVWADNLTLIAKRWHQGVS